MNNAVAIVDDSEEFRFLIGLLLESELGVKCISLPSVTALQLNGDRVLDCRLVILDINLGAGKLDGIAAYDWLRGRDYQGKIFFMTGHAKNSPQVERASRTGALILEKPMSPDEIVNILKDLVAPLQSSQNATA